MQAGSTARDSHIVAQYFQCFGLRVEVSADNLVLLVDGTYAQAGAAAHVGLARVELRGDRFTTTTGPETFPAEVAARIVATSINPGPHLRSLSVYKQTAPDAGYTPANIASYYNLNPIYSAGIKGLNRAVVIGACLAVEAKDISTFESAFSIPSNLPIVRWIGTSTTINDIEPTLGVERVVGTASSAKVYLYTIGSLVILAP